MIMGIIQRQDLLTHANNKHLTNILLWVVFQWYDLLLNCSHMNIIEHHRWKVDICSDNGLGPSNIKPLPEPKLIETYIYTYIQSFTFTFLFTVDDKPGMYQIIWCMWWAIVLMFLHVFIILGLIFVDPSPFNKQLINKLYNKLNDQCNIAKSSWSRLLTSNNAKISESNNKWKYKRARIWTTTIQ